MQLGEVPFALLHKPSYRPVELHLPTCASTLVKLSKPMVIFMPATLSEGFLMVPGAAPLKNLAPVMGPLLPLMAAIKLLPLEVVMTLLLLPLETMTKLVFAKDMVCSKKDGISMRFSSEIKEI